MALDEEVSDYLRWGLAVINAGALDNEEAAADLVQSKLEEMSGPEEMLMLIFGLIEAGAVYARAAADARGTTVDTLVQVIGLVSMEDPVA